jgi:hypothetical protein
MGHSSQEGGTDLILFGVALRTGYDESLDFTPWPFLQTFAFLFPGFVQLFSKAFQHRSQQSFFGGKMVK